MPDMQATIRARAAPTLGRRIGLPGQRFLVESLAYWRSDGRKPTMEDLSGDEQEAIIRTEKDAIVAYLSDERVEVTPHHTAHYEVAQDAYGTPDDCIRDVARLFEAGAGERTARRGRNELNADRSAGRRGEEVHGDWPVPAQKSLYGQ
jgi:hypothetical protein